MAQAIYHKTDIGKTIKDADGKTLLTIIKVTDGTLETTTLGITYGWVKEGQLVRDNDGKVRVELVQGMMFAPGRELVEILPDPKDVFVWYMLAGSPAMPVATHEEFTKILTKAQADAEATISRKKADDAAFVKDVAKEVIASATGQKGKGR